MIRELIDSGYILIVDDLDENLQVLGNTLMEKGYDVAMASSGDEAIEILLEEEELPNLILLDVMMPNKDGITTCEEIKSNPKIKDIPVIFLTAKAEVDDVIRGFDAGGVDYITKPFNAKDLLVRIRTHLELQATKKELQEKNKSLEKAYKQINDDLFHAKKYISSILPKPLINNDVSVIWKFIPAESLGGDTFGYHYLDNDNIVFYVIDVSGHGVTSSLLSVSQLNAIKTESLPDIDFKSPAQVLKKLSNSYDMMENNFLYCTMFYGVYNISSRKLRYATGGHPPAFLIQTSGTYKLFTNNPIIGGLKDTEFVESEIILDKNATLFVYTDGAFEVCHTDGTPHTSDELMEFMKENSVNTEDIDNIYSYLLDISNEEKLADDFTVLRILFK